jgi:predicted N-acetyltransferase YhbS
VDTPTGRPARARTTANLRIRAFRVDDLPAIVSVWESAFAIEPSEQEPPVSERLHARLMHPFFTDPEGCFVADLDGQVVAVVQAVRRERLWCLSLLAVMATAQGVGAGSALMDRALAYGTDTDAGLIVCSSDPRAHELYSRAGFRLQPTLQATGAINRRALPSPLRAVVEGSYDDLDALAAISRDIRGAEHTPDLVFALDTGARLMQIPGQGFVVVRPDSGVWCLVARDETAATALLSSGLAACDVGELAVRFIPAQQRWAIDLLVGLGLEVSPYGALAARGAPGPLQPFIPSAAFA